jgi:hypothetical protein
MANLTWWAKIEEGQVVDFIIVNADLDGEVFTSNLEGTWLESFDDGRRRQPAQMFGFYDSTKDEFYSPKPYPSWTLDSDNNWNAPTPKPNDGKNYAWLEEQLKWLEY